MPGRRLSPPRLLIWCALLLPLVLGSATAAGRAPVLEGTPEWVHLSVVWNTLTDHSAGLLYGQERLHELVPEMDRADADLAALVARKALPPEIANALRTVMQERYTYIEERCYGSTARLEMTELEGTEAAAHWVVEMQLDLLRQSGARGTLTSALPDPKLQQAVQANLVSELTFLQQCHNARDQFDQLRAGLDDQEGQGKGAPPGPPVPPRAKDRQAKKPDRTSVEVDWARQQRALVAAHQEHRVRADRTIERLVPYLLRLTVTPPPAPQVDVSADPPLFPF